MTNIVFDKPALDIESQIDLLLSRGLQIPNRESVKHYLSFIGYYRLAGYCLPFQLKEDRENGIQAHQFKEGTTFEQILEHYTFDRKLRVLLIDAIERIEVALRATISNSLCISHGPHWFLDKSLFVEGRHFNHADFLQALDKHLRNSRNLTFIQHYNTKYNHPPYPPSWMIMEILPFGTVSTLYHKLHVQENRKAIAQIYGINPRILSSWLHSISYLRNLCAHHSRVWNKTFTIKPEIAREHGDFLQYNNRFFAQAVIINAFLKVISPDSKWPNRLKELFDEHPTIPTGAMGFPIHWHKHAFWQYHD